MPNAKVANKSRHVTAGNAMLDLGFSPEEIQEMEIKHDLWKPMRAVIEAKNLTQAQVARTLGIHQPDASLLLRGQIARFSITRLLQFAERLQLTVKLTVVPKRSRDEAGTRVKRPRAAAVA